MSVPGPEGRFPLVALCDPHVVVPLLKVYFRENLSFP
jgi:hypothetical protein